MVTNSRKANAGKKKKVKVLSLNKETVKNLTGVETKRVKGGSVARNSFGAYCGGVSTVTVDTGTGTQTLGQACGGLSLTASLPSGVGR